MSQLWAIVSKSGAFVLRYTASIDEQPGDAGHRSEVRNKAVWPLDRDPVEYMGERVSFETGEIIFDAAAAARALKPKIKEAAGAAILREFPLWRQINDLVDGDSPEKQARHDRRSELRSRSNELEALAEAAVDRAAVEAIWDEVNTLEKGS